MFENGSPFDLLPISKLAQGFLWENDTRIGLPAFQRNAVWKEEKVEMLWDSLLCRFPIGSLLLARQSDFAEVGLRKPQLTRSDDFATVEKSNGTHDGFIVVDGQQRLNAIALGFQDFDPDNQARLWVDLKPSRDQKHSFFSFYLCTGDHPFGVGLSKAEQRQAFENVGKNDLQDLELKLNETYPFKARCPVPFVKLCGLLKNSLSWQQIKDELLQPEAHSALNLNENVVSFLQNRYQTLDPQSDYLNRLAEAIRFVAIQEEHGYSIPAILVQRQGNLMTPERLGKLFERVNINGEVPSQAEMFFSALKLKQPILNNYVAQVYNDEQIGRLFKPTDIVLNALRLANYEITDLRLDRFEDIARDNEEELLKLLQSDEGQPSLFLRSLRYAYQALHHSGQPGDRGLPRIFLQRLRPRVWQTVSWWTLQNLDELDKHGLAESDRLNILRYAVLDTFQYFIYPGQHGRAKRIADWASFITAPMRALESNNGFDVCEILETSLQEPRKWNVEYDFLSPDKYRSLIISDETKWFSLSNEICLLMYAQRDFLQRWERYELDIDHIFPSAWMYFRAGPNKSTKDFWKVENLSDDFGRFVLNTIGNKRFWPASLNRSDGDNSPGHKLSTVNAPDLVKATYGLISQEDILAASFVNEDEYDSWSKLAYQDNRLNRVWDTDRFQRFKHLVDERRIQMYDLLYKTLKLAELS